MSAFPEKRHAASRLAKILSAILGLLLFFAIALVAIAGFLLHGILVPPRSPAAVELDVMMGHPSTVSFTAPDGSQRDGWFFPGLRGAPVIIICHGYGSQRADIATLATALQEHEYNVYMFDFSGHGENTRMTTLGYRERDELRAAMQSLASRDDIDPHRIGLWGTDLGGYVALEVAATDKRVGAVAVDDPFDDPRDMVQIQVAHSGLGALPFVNWACDFGFRMMNYSFRKEPPVSSRLALAPAIPKLFIESDDRPELAAETLRIYSKAPQPKEFARDGMSYFSMSDDDRKVYENRIITFYLQAIPPEQ
ncbi:MAG TPA: alpha/beta fold hydrolase [Candidatus Acidoferrales bacterium]|nr:alpha/beta fold hydrolase [Candidatus Acidoferrales bacterium]